MVADVTNQGKVPSATQAETTASLVLGVCLLWQEAWESPVKEATLHHSLPHNVVCHAGLQSVEQPASKLSGGGYEGKLFFSLTPRGPQTF